MEFTEKQIGEYKAKYGRIFQFKCATDKTKSCILRIAGRNELSLAEMSAVSVGENGKTSFDTNKYNESILLSTWVAGDEEIKTNDALFLGVVDKLKIVIEKSEFEVKEL